MIPHIPEEKTIGEKEAMVAGRARSHARSHAATSQAMSAAIVAARGAREPPWSCPGLQLRRPASEPHDNKHPICGDVQGTQEGTQGLPEATTGASEVNE